MLKTKFVGYMFYHKDWPPKPSEIDHDICKTAGKLKFMPKTCLYYDEMPEIVLGKYKIEVIRVVKCPKKTLWIGSNINDYGDHVLGLGEYATDCSDLM
jgi:hypothetical protein